MRILLFFTFGLSMSFAQATSEDVNAVQGYVQRYAPIAMELMRTSGVPASIKLSQGILESNSGRSTLAMEANNHFGIKCGSQWNGETYYRKDDDRDHKGRLKPSCFRVFRDADDSFRAHSDFLVDPRKSYRYGFLFDLDPMDYKAWARGLKKSGYATNPKYAQLLIQIIEKYKLYEYDRQALSATPAEIIAQNPSEAAETVEKYAIREINGTKAVVYDGRMDLEHLAATYGVSVDDLYAYNDWDVDHKPAQRESIFIENKARVYRGPHKFHKANGRETIADISQNYGVDAQLLAEMMDLSITDRVKRGKKIKWKKYNAYSRKSNRNAPAKPEQQGEYLFSVDLAESRAAESKKAQVTQYHTVQQGETLFSIGRLYGLSVSELVKLNKLEGKEITKGMKLVIH